MNQVYDKFIALAIKEKLTSREDFLLAKKKISKKLGISIPPNPDLRESYNSLVSKKIINRSQKLESFLSGKNIRTASGVAVIAVLTRFFPCRGNCLYCPTEKNMPKSYLASEPAVMRAVKAGFDPYLQVQNRLRALALNGHAIDKIELIVMGGTFSHLPKWYQIFFIKECFRACNDYPKSKELSPEKNLSRLWKQLDNSQKRNEKAASRIVGLTLETRPDCIDKKEIILFRKLGCTRVELGVQSIYDDILRLNRRGHSVSATIIATRLLKDSGFKINYHIMPGLPGSSLVRDLNMFGELFSCSDFQPDMLKIYPTVVTKNSDLYPIWKKGKYRPLTDKQSEKMILEIKEKFIPRYVRIQRLVRDVPAEEIVAGPKISNLRQLIAKESRCRCIRCRQADEPPRKGQKIILNRIDYPASGGQEIFLEYCDAKKDKLFALLRLRIPGTTKYTKLDFIKQLSALVGCAIIREVHTYGKVSAIGERSKNSFQHLGLGKKLIAEAERIAKNEFGLKQIAVISGVGVRAYYRKLGYRQKDTYMIKGLQ